MIALDFDLTCTARLEIYDTERERRQLEAIGVGAASNMLGVTGTTGTGERTRPKPLNA